VLKGVPASVTTATLYPDNPTHSIFTPLGCKAFKLIQDQGTHKLITYYKTWADLEKVIGKPFSLDEVLYLQLEIKKEMLSEGNSRR
jgi:hypothetical protein